MPKTSNRNIADFVQKAFPWDRAIFPWVKWIGEEGFVRMTGNRIAKIYPRILGVHGEWVALQVKIIKKDEGEIDSKCFQFDEFIEPEITKEVTDVKGTCYAGLKVIDHCGYDWYITKPKSTLPIVKAIMDYIALFDK
jgi:hypothetical protein